MAILERSGFLNMGLPSIAILVKIDKLSLGQALNSLTLDSWDNGDWL